MSKASFGFWSTTPWMVLLTLSHRPEAFMIEKIKKTATTHMIPKAMESRNDAFVTDHGSSRTTRSLARRTVRGREPVEEGADEPGLVPLAPDASLRRWPPAAGG